jgi:hypothetical protein
MAASTTKLRIYPIYCNDKGEKTLLERNYTICVKFPTGESVSYDSNKERVSTSYDLNCRLTESAIRKSSFVFSMTGDTFVEGSYEMDPSFFSIKNIEPRLLDDIVFVFVREIDEGESIPKVKLIVRNYRERNLLPGVTIFTMMPLLHGVHSPNYVRIPYTVTLHFPNGTKILQQSLGEPYKINKAIRMIIDTYTAGKIYYEIDIDPDHFYGCKKSYLGSFDLSNTSPDGYTFELILRNFGSEESPLYGIYTSKIYPGSKFQVTSKE